MVRWREKLLQLTGYRGRMKNLGKFDASSDSEGYLLGGGGDDAVLHIESENSDDILDGCSISDDSEMDLGDTDEFCRD